MDLSFLNDVTIPDGKKGPSGGGKKVESQPTKGDIKIFKNGRIFYSDDLKAKVADGGVDFIDSSKWTILKDVMPEGKHIMFICITPKYKDEKGEVDKSTNLKLAAKVDVKKEGKIVAVTNDIIPSLEALYNLEEEFGSTELSIVWNQPFTNKNGIYNIPKIVSGGDRKGEPTTVRRENVIFYPVVFTEGVSETTPDDEVSNTAPEGEHEKTAVESTGDTTPDLSLDNLSADFEEKVDEQDQD